MAEANTKRTHAEKMTDVLVEVVASMDYTDEQWDGGWSGDEPAPSFKDYLADIERRFNFILNDGKEE
jgi:hypothetical protein